MPASTGRPASTPARQPTRSRSATRSSSPTAGTAMPPRPCAHCSAGPRARTGSSTSSPRSARRTSRRWQSCAAWASKRSAVTGTTRTARSSNSSSAPAPERPLDVSVSVALGDVAALVALLLAAADGELELRAAVLEVEPRRDDSQPFLLDLADQGLDLAPVEQQLAVAAGLVVRHVPLRVLVDVRADQPDLAVAKIRVGLGERDASIAQRLDLGSGELQARLEAIEQVVIVPRTAVFGDRLDSGGSSHPYESRVARAPARSCRPACRSPRPGLRSGRRAGTCRRRGVRPAQCRDR